MADTITELVGKTDEQLMELMGLDTQLEEFKKGLAEANKLEGKARTEVAESLKRQMTPRIYGGDLAWQVKRAKEKASGKTTPCSMCEDAGIDVS